MSKYSSNVAIYVMSCDSTADVAKHFASAFSRYWPDCPFRTFFGINQNPDVAESLRAIPLRSKKGGWRSETLEQLAELKRVSPSTKHVIIFLDDFVLSRRIDSARVRLVVTEAAARQLKYLRLRKLDEGIVGRLIQHFRICFSIGDRPCVSVRRDHPYYSSLHVALWDINYLIECVEKSDSIWSFEHQFSGSLHYSVLQSLLRYRHIVEKGKWDYGAERYCRKHVGWFKPGDRPRRVGLGGFLRKLLAQGVFVVFGYAPSQLRKYGKRKLSAFWGRPDIAQV